MNKMNYHVYSGSDINVGDMFIRKNTQNVEWYFFLSKKLNHDHGNGFVVLYTVASWFEGKLCVYKEQIYRDEHAYFLVDYWKRVQKK